ncbi:MAG: hypothetical protein Ct9H90mP9_3100 [Pseudomonadota bacterium]|nr:MAG: hypothetical protein Ct9H90mP9_3100 [Pseudomonadota bacterium]
MKGTSSTRIFGWIPGMRSGWSEDQSGNLESDPENAGRYQENSKFLQQKLKRLDQHLEQGPGCPEAETFRRFSSCLHLPGKTF